MKKSVHPRARWYVFFAKPRARAKVKMRVFFTYKRKREGHIYAYFYLIFSSRGKNEDCIVDDEMEEVRTSDFDCLRVVDKKLAFFKEGT